MCEPQVEISFPHPIQSFHSLAATCHLQGIIYGLWAKWCYTDKQRDPESYAETIYSYAITIREVSK